MQQLGLGESASLDEIKRAFRRLAQELHPDKHGGDDAARRRFIAVVRAYRMLVNAARAVEQGKGVGVCRDCGELGEATTGLDGHARCHRCMFRPEGGRLLPLPVFVVVKCVTTILLLAGAAYLLMAAISTGEGAYAIGAFIGGLLAIGALAHTCLSVVHCLHPRERAMARKQQARARADSTVSRGHGRR